MEILDFENFSMVSTPEVVPQIKFKTEKMSPPHQLGSALLFALLSGFEIFDKILCNGSDFNIIKINDHHHIHDSLRNYLRKHISS